MILSVTNSIPGKEILDNTGKVILFIFINLINLIY